MGLYFAAPRMRASLYYLGICLSGMCGFFNGYAASRTLKFFSVKLADWRYSALFSCMIFPCYLLLILCLADIVEWYSGNISAGAIGPGFALFSVWWLIHGTAAFIGAWKGFQKDLAVLPEVGSIKRTLPPRPWYLKQLAIGGVYSAAIFGSFVFEVYYLMESLWTSYMTLGLLIVLLVSLLIMSVTIAAVSVMVTYQLLRHQCYDWVWSSYSVGASGGLYMFAYAVYYLAAYEDMSFLSGDFFYFVTMMLVCSCFSVMCGSVSLFSSYWFAERIYIACSKGDFTRF